MALPYQTIEDAFFDLAVHFEEAKAEEEAMAHVRTGASVRAIRITAAAAVVGGVLVLPVVAAAGLLAAAAWLVLGVPALTLGAIAVVDRLVGDGEAADGARPVQQSQQGQPSQRGGSTA